MYSCDSDVTRQACEDLGWSFACKFIETEVVGDKIHVSGTVGRPEDWIALEADCKASGGKYIYKGRQNRNKYGYRI